jgi:hypothetical protein
MNIWIHKPIRTWRDYTKPVWLNITANEGDPKIYRWLWFGYVWGVKKTK